MRRAAFSNSEREFERLYRESYSLVFNYIAYRMPGSAAVEDVVADAFMQAARHFSDFDPSRAKFSTWVVSIAKNCVNGYYRKARPTVALENVSEASIAVDGGQDDVDNGHLVAQLLRALDDEERELVYLKYHLGMRNVEIAEELGMNASTLSTKLSRAMAKMRAAC